MVVLAHCHKVLLLLTKVDASVSIKVMLRVEHHSDHILENTFFFSETVKSNLKGTEFLD